MIKYKTIFVLMVTHLDCNPSEPLWFDLSANLCNIVKLFYKMKWEKKQQKVNIAMTIKTLQNFLFHLYESFFLNIQAAQLLYGSPIKTGKIYTSNDS